MLSWKLRVCPLKNGWLVQMIHFLFKWFKMWILRVQKLKIETFWGETKGIRFKVNLFWPHGFSSVTWNYGNMWPWPIFAERSFPPCFSHFKPFNHFCFYGSLIMQFHFSTCLRKTVYKCSTSIIKIYSCLINTGRKSSIKLSPHPAFQSPPGIFLTFLGPPVIPS